MANQQLSHAYSYFWLLTSSKDAIVGVHIFYVMSTHTRRTESAFNAEKENELGQVASKGLT